MRGNHTPTSPGSIRGRELMLGNIKSSLNSKNMIEIVIILGSLYLSYRLMRKPGEKFFYPKNEKYEK